MTIFGSGTVADIFFIFGFFSFLGLLVLISEYLFPDHDKHYEQSAEKLKKLTREEKKALEEPFFRIRDYPHLLEQIPIELDKSLSPAQRALFNMPLPLRNKEKK